MRKKMLNSGSRVTDILHIIIFFAMGAYAVWMLAGSLLEKREAVELERLGKVASGSVLEKLGGTSSVDPPRIIYLFRTESGATIRGVSSIEAERWRALSVGDAIDVIYSEHDSSNNRPAIGSTSSEINSSRMIASFVLLLIASAALLMKCNAAFRERAGMAFRGTSKRRFWEAKARLAAAGI